MTTNGSNEPRDVAVPKYFRRTPKKPSKPHLEKADNATLYIGLVILAISVVIMLTGGWGICGGILGILIGGGIALGGWSSMSDTNNKNKKSLEEYESQLKQYEKQYQQAEPKPSDQQMDAWLAEDITKFQSDAMQELDLDPDDIQQDAITVIGPSHNAAIAIGKDGVVRYSMYDIVIVFLTEYHLAAYNATFSMSTGTPTRESTQEYHYSDIVSVFTKTESSEEFILVYQGENKKIPVYKEFSLSVASGEKIRVVTPFDSPEFLELFESKKTEEVTIPETGADRAVRLIRARLREKKGGTHV